jgi:hypothetical protein
MPKVGRRDLEITTKNQRVRSDEMMLVNWQMAQQRRAQARREDIDHGGETDSDRSSGASGKGRALCRSVHQATIAPD